MLTDCGRCVAGDQQPYIDFFFKVTFIATKFMDLTIQCPYVFCNFLSVYQSLNIGMFGPLGLCLKDQRCKVK